MLQHVWLWLTGWLSTERNKQNALDKDLENIKTPFSGCKKLFCWRKQFVYAPLHFVASSFGV